ncbi:M81 family metallopeptidase [Burkholderia sp. L27(2015)]|uniref:M81 family metallopeptidase n=1 Tax=Burkholderia sp. L27(2015) TaxID=1641858 RepID=UPI00131CB655|nr:M81 family metallopeptidase [Burkholderia sp. L27(2015)]
MPIRVLIAGFQHETNTFAPSMATYQSFERGEGFPALVRGGAVLGLSKVNIPMGGFIQAAGALGFALKPVIWAGASPSAHVTADAFERIAQEIVAATREQEIDAIYLDLHGAMVAEHVDDGEGELLARLRTAVGTCVPIVISLDLHANVTQRMLAHADVMVAYRTYPHVDMAETGRRAAQLLDTLLRSDNRPHLASKRLPFLVPINGMCTLLEPASGMYERLAQLEVDTILSLSFAPGFPAADFPECGPTIWGYGSDAAVLQATIDQLYEKMLRDESAWEVTFLTPDAAVTEAMRLARSASKPVVIADTQDNPGAGGDANTMGMVRALLRNGVSDAAVGLIWDPHAAAAAHAAGAGARIRLALGGLSGVPGDEPLVETFEVESLSDGKCRYDGPMMNGMLAELGLVACLKVGGVRIAVSSSKAQMLDRNLYRVANIEPEAMKILVNKSSVHFRADFQAMAHAVLVAKAPGPMTADPADLPWTRLEPGIRTRPMGSPFVPVGSDTPSQ